MHYLYMHYVVVKVQQLLSHEGKHLAKVPVNSVTLSIFR